MPGHVRVRGRIDVMAGRHEAGASGRAGFHLQVEHGLDARHARLHEGGSGPSQVASQQDHLLDDVRLQREVRAAVLARRGRARQAIDARQDAGRCLAEARQPARALRLHVRASRQEADVHGRRDRPVARVEPRLAARLGGARRSAPRRPAALGPRSQSLSTREKHRCGTPISIPPASRGSIATITSTASLR